MEKYGGMNATIHVQRHTGLKTGHYIGAGDLVLYFFGAAAAGGGSLLGGTIPLIRMYVTRLP